MLDEVVDPVRLGRAVCGVLDGALRREWLVTDGSGSFACGTVAGALTRRYHGLLVAATEPPVGRVVTAAGLSEAVVVGSETLQLHTQEWASGAVEPRGYELVEAFWLDGVVPTWRYALPGALLVKRVWMGLFGGRASVTYVTYTVERAAAGVEVGVTVRPLCTWRDYHALGRAGQAPAIALAGSGLGVTFGGAPGVWVRGSCDGGADVRVDAAGEWYRDFRLRVETERGMDDVQDLYAAGSLTVTLGDGQTFALSISLDAHANSADAAESLDAVRARSAALLSRSRVGSMPPWIARLVLAADQFIAVREGMETMMAGFPWFGDWGRDTMISLPGLALCTGRPELAAGLLRGFARFVRDGLLPNRFPDHGETPEYNTVDATLWYVEAIRAYEEVTGDSGLVRELWPVLDGILSAHVAGTVHGIGVDARDGLLHSGSPGLQLTWMDAKVDGWVVTPRVGKPVEVNALWHNAVTCMEEWSRRLGLRTSVDAAALRAQVAASFGRYWNAETGYLYDVLDGPDGDDDDAVRPNAVIAAALTHTPLGAERIAAVVTVAQRHLVTSLGLRSLAPASSGYTPIYAGSTRDRDAAYHQGTVWPWLLGSFVIAHHRAFGDAAVARSFIEPLADHLADAGLGSISEIADASPPHTPRGCPWQAWSVAEILRAWRAIGNASTPSARP